MVSSRPLDAPEGGFFEHIHGIVVEGDEPVHSFLASLNDPDFSEFYAEFKKLESGILILPQWPRMGNWFKPLKHVSNVWQVSSTTHRLLGFRRRDALVFTNGFYKAGGSTPAEQIDISTKLHVSFEASQ